jgi:hypothetical protein
MAYQERMGSEVLSLKEACAIGELHKLAFVFKAIKKHFVMCKEWCEIVDELAYDILSNLGKKEDI